MNTKKYLLVLIVFTVTSHLFAQDKFTLVKEGAVAPNFTYETKDGKTIKLSELKGKVVWINFFATWCPPCRQELPHLQKEVYEKYKNNNDFVLMIFGREHSWEEINKFTTEQNFTMPFYPDKERLIFSMYAKQNIPRNFIIDKEGKIAVSSSGFNEKEFNKMIGKVEILLH